MAKVYATLYIFLEAIRNIKSNFITTVLTVITIGLSLAVFTFFVVVLINIKGVIKTWGEKIQIVAYIKDRVPYGKIDQMAGEIKNIAGIEKVDYVSKKKALDILREDLKGYKDILDSIDSNPLPASFEIRVKPEYRDRNGIDNIIAKLRGIGGIDDIQYGQKWVERFSAILRFIELFTIVIGVFLAAATLFIISNTIRLTVYARREEIEVARLVGASELYIKAPFFIEGVVQGFVGALLASGILFFEQYLLYKNIPSTFASVVESPFSFAATLAGLTFAGVLLGISGSMISLGRFLRV
ncbi:MAG: permease-like cell division protein FtsX [Thermodesulfobacteriota bacterium]